MRSDLDKIYESKRNSGANFGMSLSSENALMSDKDMAILRDAIDRKSKHPVDIDDLTRSNPNKFSSGDIYQIAESTIKCSSMTYNQAFRTIEMVGMWTNTNKKLTMATKNTFKDFLYKYRKGFTPPRNERGEPLVRKEEVSAAIAVTAARVSRREFGEDSEVLYFTNGCQYFFESVMD